MITILSTNYNTDQLKTVVAIMVVVTVVAVEAGVAIVTILAVVAIVAVHSADINFFETHWVFAHHLGKISLGSVLHVGRYEK